jgi:hypothetical protein
VSALLRRAVFPILALALPSCWLTESFSGLMDAGAPEAASDAAFPDARRDGANDGGTDASGDGSPSGDGGGFDSHAHGDSGDARADTSTHPDASCTTSTTYAASVVAANPLAYWPLDETSGTTAHDVSGNSNDATYTGGFTLAQNGVLPGEKSVLLDGLSGQILASVATFDDQTEFQGTMQSYSLEAWIKPTTIDSDYRGIMGNELDGDAGKEGYIMYLQQDAGIGFDRYHNGSSTPLHASGTFAENSWYHVVGVYDYDTTSSKGTMYIYVNGTQAASSGTTEDIIGGCTFSVGSTHCGTEGFFQGYMQNVAVYASALDMPCIEAHHNLGIGK